MTSKYKDDLGFIRDMHRLLSYKGYIFPEVKREDAAVLNPSDVRYTHTILVDPEQQAHSLPDITISRGNAGRRKSSTVSQAARVDKKRHPS